jgi:uncharacterized membrane protein (DUF485 family)
MPTNKWIYIGVLVVVAAACIWLGARLLERIEWVVPFALGIGILLILVGLVIEMRKRKAAVTPGDAGAASERL